MGRPHPIELRERVVAFVEEGHSHRAAATHFRVSPRFVNNMMILKRETGSVSAMRQGHGGAASKLKDHGCLLYTSPSPRDVEESRMPSSA